MDLSQLSQADLLSLCKQVDAAIRQREHEARQQAQDQIRAIARQVGKPLTDILGGGKSYPAHNRIEKVPVRYRHPNKPNLQWTGRGRSPQWVLDWEDAHRGSRQGLLISTNGDEKDAQ